MAEHRIKTLAEVAEEYRFSERWVRDFIKQHAIPVLRTKNFIRFDQRAIDAFEEALRPAPKVKLPMPPRERFKLSEGSSAYDELLERRAGKSAYERLQTRPKRRV